MNEELLDKIPSFRNEEDGIKDLVKFLKDNGCKYGVEVGCYIGGSTKFFAEAFNKLFCVDPWKNGYDREDPASEEHDMELVEEKFNRNILYKFNNVAKMKMTSEEASKFFDDETVDFVYIDGKHRYEDLKLDIELWLPKIKKNGYIGGHDYYISGATGMFKEVYDAVSERFGDSISVFGCNWYREKI